VTAATALNLIRVHAGGNGHPLDLASGSHLTRLEPALTA
jgi:hypothetical protein